MKPRRLTQHAAPPSIVTDRMAHIIAVATTFLWCAPPQMAFAQAASSPTLVADAARTDAGSNDIVVTAKRLNDARASIQPQIGASVYRIDKLSIDSMPGGDNSQLNQVILQAPGVAQDSFGQFHIRGDHNGLQYRLNGIALPEGLSVFGETLSPRLASSVSLITGALPAEYGLRTAGVVDIATQTGFRNGGSVSIYGGSHGEYQPSFETSGSSGSNSFFLSGSFERSQLGIESPDGRSTPAHDRLDQAQAFFYGDHIIDETSRVSLIAGTSNSRFQLPNSVGLTPSALDGIVGPGPDGALSVNGRSDFESGALNDTQREVTHYGAVSYLYSNADLTLQTSLFARYSSLTFRPDGNFGDLLFTGISQYAAKRDTALGLQTEGVYNLNDAHTLRGGVIIQTDRATSSTSSNVLPVGDLGFQTSDAPFQVNENNRQVAWSYSTYLQDEWTLLDNLTLNYGVRFDQVNAYRNENQLSPRINLVWKPTTETTVHAGYSRYFTPAPFEIVANQTASNFVGTTAQFPNGTTATTPFAERDNYYDVGVSQKLSSALTVGLDTYYKQARNLLDEGQFGAPIILTPFNYADGRTYGAELSLTYKQGPLSAYASFAYSKAQGRNIVSSQFLFDPGDLDYIASHYIYLDHDQTYTGSLGASYLIGGTRIGGDLLYGSGLRADGAVPNGRGLADYIQVNLSLSHSFVPPRLGPLELRFDIINAFDKQYEIRDGSGVGVGAPQFGPRRGFFVGLTREF